MSYDDDDQPAENTENTENTGPIQPKTLTPYRHKLRKSASKIARAMSGVENLSQADQVAAFQFVLGEIRKMAGGATKALELAQGRDYEAYKNLKAKVKAGIPLDQIGASGLDPATATEFQLLMASLGLADGQGEYAFDANEVDEAGQKAAEFQANQGTDQPGDTPSFD